MSQLNDQVPLLLLVVPVRTSTPLTANFMSAAPIAVPRKVTIPPVGFVVITGAVGDRPVGCVIARLVVVGPTADPVAPNVAVCVCGGSLRPLSCQESWIDARLKSSDWLSAVPVVPLSEHQGVEEEWVP